MSKIVYVKNQIQRKFAVCFRNGLVSLFNAISTFVGNIMPNPSF